MSNEFEVHNFYNYTIDELKELEEEFNYLYDYYNKGGNTITPDVQRRMVEINNRVFGEKVQITACGSCFLNNVHKKLEKVLNQYL